MRERMPELTQVFLDPSEVTTGDLHRMRQRERQLLDDVDQLNGPSGSPSSGCRVAAQLGALPPADRDWSPECGRRL
jgi:hypothetical protein